MEMHLEDNWISDFIRYYIILYSFLIIILFSRYSLDARRLIYNYVLMYF